MLPQKIWNLGPLKSLKMLPILSIIGKKAHNFFPFIFIFYFLLACWGMVRPVLSVTFFLLEIDNSVTCLKLLFILFIKYTMFLNFFGKIIGCSGPTQYQSQKRCHITRG